MNKILPGLIFVFFSTTLIGQSSWQEKIQNPQVNFYDVQNAFETELGDLPYQKGLGIKQFRRWEYYWDGRVNEKGEFPVSGHVLNEMTNYYNTHSDSRNYWTWKKSISI